MTDRSAERAARWGKPTIVGELVTLRPADEQDVEAAWEMVNDPEGNDLTATTESFERSQIEEWYRSRPDQPDRLDLAIVENATGLFAGEVVLNEFDADHNSASFRISMRGPAWSDRGLGTEATKLIISHGLEAIGLAHIDLEVLARNPRARRVYEKVGFEVIGEMSEDGEDWVAMRITSGR